MISRKAVTVFASATMLLAAAFVPAVSAQNHLNNRNGVRHVVLVSVDGMHVLDYINCVNGGYCPNLAALGQHAINYLDIDIEAFGLFSGFDGDR